MTACENICPLKEELNEIVPDAEKVQAREAAWQKEVKEKRMSVIELKASEIPTEKVDYQPVPDVYKRQDGLQTNDAGYAA